MLRFPFSFYSDSIDRPTVRPFTRLTHIRFEWTWDSTTTTTITIGHSIPRLPFVIIIKIVVLIGVRVVSEECWVCSVSPSFYFFLFFLHFLSFILFVLWQAQLFDYFGIFFLNVRSTGNWFFLFNAWHVHFIWLQSTRGSQLCRGAIKKRKKNLLSPSMRLTNDYNDCENRIEREKMKSKSSCRGIGDCVRGTKPQ